MEKTTLYLDRSLRGRITRCGRETGRPQAEVIRDALRAALVPRKRPRSIGLGKGGRHLSERADRLLKGLGE